MMKVWFLATLFAWITLTNGAIALPSGIFDLPEGVITAGGTAEWRIISSGASSEDGLQTTLTNEQPSAWLDLAVTGPAEVSCSLGEMDSWAQVEFWVDGISTAVTDRYQNRELIIEVPAGAHLVRIGAKLSPEYRESHSVMASVLKLEITQLAAPGKLIPALNGNLPVVTQGPWEVVTPLSGATGNSSIRPTQESADLKIGFVGPGYLDFRFALSREQTGRGSMMRVTSNTHPSWSDYFYFNEEMPGWREGRQWLPPGPQNVSFNILGDTLSISQSALDTVRFTQSAIVSVEDALDAPGVIWENDSAAPWIGALRNAPSDDVVVSPAVMGEQSTRLATTLNGPGVFSFVQNIFQGSGQVEFRVAGEPLLVSPNDQDGRATIQLLDSTPTRIEWIVSGDQRSSLPSLRLLLDDVQWTPHPVSSLGSALDTSSAVSWSTRPQKPFTGRPHPWAMNGTAAYIALKPGEESWIEATVNGPGRFDFWLREAAGIPLPNFSNVWNYWSLTIDGIPVQISGNQWPEQWITGDGPHRIRLSFRHPSTSYVQWITGAVDEVTWIPMGRTTLANGSGLRKHLWQTSRDAPAKGFSNAGRDGSAAMVMNPPRGKTSWAQTIVIGPCELSWDSVLKDASGDMAAKLEVNRAIVTEFNNPSWQRMRLSLPKGIHVLRWVCENRSEAESDNPLEQVPFSQVWQIGGMRISKGLSSLSQAVDSASLYALETGDDGGQRVVVGRSDYWKPGLHTALYFFDPRQTGKLLARYWSPEEGWIQQDESQAGVYLPSSEGGWLTHASVLHPGGFSKWSFDPGDIEPAVIEFPRLSSLKFESGDPMELAAAVESPQPLSSNEWLGYTNRNAKVGKDFAWSLLNQENSMANASVTLAGPATLSYWWKKQGNGNLTLSLDGGYLPVPPPSTEWTKVELTIPSGNHTLVWSHSLGFLSANAGSIPRLPPSSEAWLDGLVFQRTMPMSLTAAGTVNGNPALSSSTNFVDFLPWQPISYREADGAWTDAVRVVSGGRNLHATVTGPVVIEFRSRCFQGDVRNPPRRFLKSVVLNTGPDFGFQTTGHLLTVDVDGISQLRVDKDPSGAWRSFAVHVPAGVHELRFRLMAVRSSFSSTILENATEPNVQAWVDDLRIISPAERYAEWTISQGLAADQSGKNDDPDADGSNNLMEYCFNTDSRDATSVPLNLEIGMFALEQMEGERQSPSSAMPNPWEVPYPFLKIPYLAPHAAGALESSEDLVNWHIEPIEMLSYPAFPTRVIAIGEPQSTQTYHVLQLPRDVPKRYYRLAIHE